MSALKPTEGPWYFDLLSTQGAAKLLQLRSAQHKVATVSFNAKGATADHEAIALRRCAADAALIVAAPDMLDALRELLLLLQIDDNNAVTGIFSTETYEAIITAHAAVAKAEGR